MRIFVNQEAVEIDAQAPDLYRALATAGLLDGACGGLGACGKCGVRYVSAAPPAGATEQHFFTPAQLQQGWRLACRQQAQPDLALEIAAQDGAAAIVGGYQLTLTLPQGGKSGYGMALDIGTTTLAALLFDYQSGRQLAAATRLNSQRRMGQDVISRIHHAQTQPDGLTALRRAVRDDIAALLQELCAASGVAPAQIAELAVAGNPTMIHILAGVDPTHLGLAPYHMAFSGERYIAAAELDLPLAAGAMLYAIPAVAAYLGGDIVGGLLAAGLPQQNQSTLFLDLGTNGEIVLARQGELFACSTAAGPALEGMNIRHGMRAAAGVIDAVSIADGTVQAHVIGGKQPVGISGSGLIAAVSALRQHDLLNDNGRLQLAPPLLEEGKMRLLPLTSDGMVVLTQQDVREFQLAKGAILSGVQALLEAVSCSAADIDEALVAGGFGYHLERQDICRSGLLPPQFEQKIRYLGNSALAGAVLCLFDEEYRRRAAALAASVHYIDLAALPDYQERFVGAMLFE